MSFVASTIINIEGNSGQKEGNGKYPQRFALSEQVCDLHPVCFIIEEAAQLALVNRMMYTYQNSRIIRHTRFRLLILFLFSRNFDVLHITSSKDNVVELLIRRRHEVLGWTAFGAKRENIFQCDSRLLRIDFEKSAQVTNLALRYEVEALSEECSQRQRSTFADLSECAIPYQVIHVHLEG